LLELVGLPDEKKVLKAYSKGMQQRLGLAQALLNDPELLFLDEPTEGLDPIGRKQVRDLLVDLRSRGKTIFLNSHILSEVEMICDQMMILKKGEMVRAGKPSDFTRRTGEYRLHVAAVTDAVHAAAESVLGVVKWNGTALLATVKDRAQLNLLIDRLRAAGGEIEALEPVKNTLEEFFIEVATSDTTGKGGA
jgi:ABC-2 type transport system ATP-binding protein